jgi:hypothetical protein
MGMRPRHVINAGASLIVVLLLSASPSAQRRFEALKQDTIPEVAGLKIITVRDTLLNTCYTLFMMESPVAADANAPSEPPIDDAKRQSLQRLRDAAVRHDREVSELRTQFEWKNGVSPEMARIPGLVVEKNIALGDSLVRYEADRLRVDSEYESVLRAEMPGSLPIATAVPGMKTGSWEDAAEATRRLLANPDPGTLKTPADPGLNSQVASWMQHMSDGPRLSASGPVPCNPPKTAKKN